MTGKITGRSGFDESKREGQMCAEWDVQDRVGWVEQRETHAGFPAAVTGAWVSRCSTHPTFCVLRKHFPVQLGPAQDNEP